MNERLKEITSSINTIEAELAKVKALLSEMTKPSLAKQIFAACPTEEEATARDLSETIAWKQAHPEFSTSDYK